jgi:hypothetical protein
MNTDQERKNRDCRRRESGAAPTRYGRRMNRSNGQFYLCSSVFICGSNFFFVVSVAGQARAVTSVAKAVF